MFVIDRDNDINLHVVRIEVQHEVGKDPVVERTLFAIAAQIAPIAPGNSPARRQRADGRVLCGVVTERLNTVLIIVNFTKETGMGNRDMVAFQIIVYIDLPVAVHNVVTSLDQLHLANVKVGGRWRAAASFIALISRSYCRVA